MYAVYLLVWGIVAHLVADWFFQNEWMAVNKVNWRHPAAWTHSGFHFIALLFVFHFPAAFLLAASHFIIDLRTLLRWWRKTIAQTPDASNPVAMHVAFWQDQAAHVLCLAVAAYLCGR